VTLTHADLVVSAARWLGRQRCVVILAECGALHGCQIPDAIGWRNDGTSISVECKVSVEDYLRDQHKRSHQEHRLVGQLRYYLTPPTLVQPLLHGSTPKPRFGYLSVAGVGTRVTTQRPAERFDEWSGIEEVLLLISELRRVAGGFRGKLPTGLQHATALTRGIPGKLLVEVPDISEELRSARRQVSQLTTLLAKERARVRSLNNDLIELQLKVPA
jgi:hypothetical protein